MQLLLESGVNRHGTESHLVSALVKMVQASDDYKSVVGEKIEMSTGNCKDDTYFFWFSKRDKFLDRSTGKIIWWLSVEVSATLMGCNDQSPICFYDCMVHPPEIKRPQCKSLCSQDGPVDPQHLRSLRQRFISLKLQSIMNGFECSIEEDAAGEAAAIILSVE